LTYLDIAFIAIVVAVVIFPPLGLFIFDVATGVFIVAGVVGLGIVATTLVGNLVYNAAPDEGRDEVAACEDKVDREYRRCKEDAESALFPDAAKALCYADWLVEVAECWGS
jgi:hypothetical protein